MDKDRAGELALEHAKDACPYESMTLFDLARKSFIAGWSARDAEVKEKIEAMLRKIFELEIQISRLEGKQRGNEF